MLSARHTRRKFKVWSKAVVLDGLLLDRRDVLSGILNGIDVTDWNPQTDPNLVVATTLPIRSLMENELANWLSSGSSGCMKMNARRSLGLSVDWLVKKGGR